MSEIAMTAARSRITRVVPSTDPARSGRLVREVEEVLPLPFVEVPPTSDANTLVIVQRFFQAKRFCVYADDASKLRVKLVFWGREIVGTSAGIDIPAAIFSDGPVVDRAPFVLHCSECGAPTKEGQFKCSYCQAPFTWRVTETAFGMSGLALEFPPLRPGMHVQATFTNRSRSAIGVDAAFVGLVEIEEDQIRLGNGRLGFG
ncbi:MAG: hypothetical protein ACLP1X_27075 [Polyangiaceae bacterium]